CTAAQAQQLPGRRDSIYSALLKEERVIQVLLPEGHVPGSGQKYDVLYVLDGDSSLKFLAPIQQFAQAESPMPRVILVAIFNTQRDRDLLPTGAAPGAPDGAANFLAFLKNELIPYVDKSYPTSGSNLLYGHSYGGL